MLKVHLNGEYTEISTVVTHSGKFHADEVYAIAILKVAATIDRISDFDFNGEYDAVGIERTNDIERFSNCSNILFVDIGGGTYDHHQVEETPEHWEDGTCKASVGRLFTAVRDIFVRVCGTRCANTILEEVVKPIDHNDTTGFSYVLATMVDAYNSNDVNVERDQDSRFIAVLEKATEHIWALACAGHERLLRMKEIKKSAAPLYSKSFDGPVVLCTKRVYAEEVSEMFPEAIACIYPHERGDFVVRSLSGSVNTPWLAPEQFRGQRDTEELKRHGATFCHKNGFIMGFESMTDATMFMCATLK